MRVFIMAVLLSMSMQAFANKDFSSWRKFSQGALLTETTAFAPGSRATAGLYIKLAPKWHTYWVNPGDSGAPIRLSFRNSAGVKVRDVLMPRPSRYLTGPLVSFGYSDEVLFLIEIEVDESVTPGTDVNLVVDAEWLVCEDVCIPAIDTLSVKVPVRALADVGPSPDFSRFQRARREVPREAEKVPQWEERGERLELAFTQPRGEFVDFFPFRASGATNEKPKQRGDEPLRLSFEKSGVPRAAPDRVGMLITRDPRTGRLEAETYGKSGWTFEEQMPESGEDFWWMLVSAFIGGLILNLMPCVFPILSIKLLGLLKLSSAQWGEVRKQNLAYVAGVLVSFLGIALLLAGLRSAGHLIGWGFQLQSPVFLSLLCWLFFILALNLFGVFEIEFLNAGVGGKLTRLRGHWGSFFTGVLAVVVASPCTAPFMGVALGFGLTRPFPVLVAIFLALGLGLALPYLLVAIFPRLVRLLPKPGRWMNVVKQVMAFPLLLTLLWLLWILSQVRGNQAVIIVLAGCLAIGFAFWLPAWGKRAAKIAAGLIVVLGLIYIYRADRRAMTSVNSDVWQVYSESLVDSLKGKPAFVNMTADWCLTCKVNERLVFDDPEVMKLLASKNVALIKGDWTQRNEEITRYLNRYRRVGVPFYVLYSPRHPDGLPLPEVLTKSSFMELIQKEFP